MSDSFLLQSLNPNKPLDRPLTTTEKQVLNVLYSPRIGEQPDEATRQMILAVSQQSPSQWLATINAYPELVQAIHSFIYGNLCERGTGKPCE